MQKQSLLSSNAGARAHLRRFRWTPSPLQARREPRPRSKSDGSITAGIRRAAAPGKVLGTGLLDRCPVLLLEPVEQLQNRTKQTRRA